MMKGKVIDIFAVIALIFAVPSAWAKSKGEIPSFLEAKVDRTHTVEGERIIYEVTLFTPEPSVAGAEVTVNPDFTDLVAVRAASDSHMDRVKRDGVVYYTAVIDRFFVGTNTKGKYSIAGGDYKVGFNRQVTVNDPFWGPSVAHRVEVIDLSAPTVKIEVSELPEKGKPKDFTGAIGKFNVEISFHSDVKAGEESCLLITVSGQGDLTDSGLPDVREAFGDGIHFKSMTENRSHFIQQGRLGSEMEMECSFVVEKPGRYVINPVRFTYFDSEKGKYVTAESNSLEVDVPEAKPDNTSPPVIMDI